MDYLPGILSGESGEIFMSYFKIYLKELFSRSGESASGIAPRDYIMNHMVCDFAETVRWWTRNKNYSPEEISSFFIETTPLMGRSFCLRTNTTKLSTADDGSMGAFSDIYLTATAPQHLTRLLKIMTSIVATQPSHYLT